MITRCIMCEGDDVRVEAIIADVPLAPKLHSTYLVHTRCADCGHRNTSDLEHLAEVQGDPAEVDIQSIPW